MILEKNIWEPISFDEEWLNVQTERFDNIRPSWERKRAEFKTNTSEYKRFINELKRKQAIDTGIIERMYDLKEGITETFIKEGFVESYLQHGDTNIEKNQLMLYIKDNFEAIDFIFDFVKNNRNLSVGFINEIHALITRHQAYTEAINAFGHRVKVELLKGQYKKHPNNPRREDENEDIKFIYCPPEHVASEMDKLIQIYNTELNDSVHPVVKAAFLHHAFTQIHPFQDGNGRIARLLASLILVNDNLFPLTIDRKDKKIYIDALESADSGNYQPVVDFLCSDQVKSIEKALNWKTVTADAGYQEIVEIFANKVRKFKVEEFIKRNFLIDSNRSEVFSFCIEMVNKQIEGLRKQLEGLVDISITSNIPDSGRDYYFTHQIVTYANQHDYYFNASLPRGWVKISIELSEEKKYNLIFSLHHYGYDNSTFALGTFLEYVVSTEKANKYDQNHVRKSGENRFISIPLEIKPLTMSAEKDIVALKQSIERFIQDVLKVTLAFLANEF